MQQLITGVTTIGLDLAKATGVVQGFGNVGSIAALSLARYGVKIIAVSDVRGGVYNANGLNLWDLEKHVAKTRTVIDFPESDPISNEELLVLPDEARKDRSRDFGIHGVPKRNVRGPASAPQTGLAKLCDQTGPTG